MRIGILQAGHTADVLRPAHGDYDAMFARLLAGHGFEAVPYDVEHMQFPSDPRACDGWLVTGSRHGVYEDHAFIPPLADFLRSCFDADVPVVGVCFGHQMVAHAMGGRVERFPGGWSLGRQTYDTEAGPLSLNAWHQDQVVEAPEGAEALASSPFCRNAVLSYGRRAWTIQPHPEFGGEVVAEYARTRRGTLDYPDADIDRAARDAALPVDQARLADHIAGVLAKAEAPAHA